jgi:putative peptidoglycan lipid II flippase
MIPGMFGVAAIQINLLLTTGIAFAMDGSIVASFNYAVRLMELPQGVFGISLATFILPALAGLAAENKMKEFSRSLSLAFDYVFFLNLFVGALLLVLAEPIVRLLFERGAFGAEATSRASLALMCLAPGLVAFSAVNIFARAFFAIGDTRTPMRISVLCLALNLVLVVILIGPYQQAGMGIANSISSTLNAFLLFAALKRKRSDIKPDANTKNRVLTGLCVLLAAGAAWKIWEWCDAWLGHDSLTARLIVVFLPLASAAAIYGVSALALRIPAARDIAGMVSKTKRLSGKETA